MVRPVTILMGPTASGKSALALALAKREPTVIINADAMQYYDVLPIVTARPSGQELASAEHQLYGVWQPNIIGSVAQWVEAAAVAVRAAWSAGKHPLIVGGTGMYIKALMEGLSLIPATPEAVRAGVREAYASEGVAAIYAALCEEDALMAARLKAGDSQRIMRALEVVRASGQSLAVWQQQKDVPALAGEAEFMLTALRPERKMLYARIDARFDAMMAAGALEEVQEFLAEYEGSECPVVKACGVPELAAYLRGELTLDAAVSLAKQHSRNYAKRQMTWITNQCPNAMDAANLLS